MAISTHTFDFLGTIIFWIGVVACCGGLFLFGASSTGFSGSDPETLSQDDTYYVIPPWQARIYLLAPVVAGGILIATGWKIHSHKRELEQDLHKISENWKP